MRQGNTPQRACELAIERIYKRDPVRATSIQVGFIALNKAGETGAYCLHSGFNYAKYDSMGNTLTDAQYKLGEQPKN